MMDKLIHMWIMIFVVIFVAFTVKSSDDTQPNSDLKTEVRSAAWRRHTLLQDSSNDGDEFKKLTPAKRTYENTRVVCVKTAATVTDEVGTSNNILIKEGSTQVTLTGGCQNGRRCCVGVETTAFANVDRVNVRTSGSDKWRPDSISVYLPETGVCHFCPAMGDDLCSTADECEVSMSHDRDINCFSSEDVSLCTD